jgi:hypothetical protein
VSGLRYLSGKTSQPMLHLVTEKDKMLFLKML